MSNHLKNQVSPYLLQHADNPVDWFPWCDEAFEKAKLEDKPIFLSIGYSTCHWCHVMAHESFENDEVARLLNDNFVSIKVDKEERPDIDSIYMSVCQAFTGSGGWPTSIFMTPDQKPFFAGTYFPLERKYDHIGLKELLKVVKDRWKDNREGLIQSGNEITRVLNQETVSNYSITDGLIDIAIEEYRQSYDSRYGGFGNAPKFPAPHNLLFLLSNYEKAGKQETLDMVENTLIQMYRGGIFDHIGYGFSRYSTDRYFLVPHFEKMLYDNALLILAYAKTYELTNKSIYYEIAEKTADYVLRELTSKNGGFFSAQDADSDGEEGKYYLFTPKQIIQIIGEKEGTAFNSYYDITPKGNFNGVNIPNLLNSNLEFSLNDKANKKLLEYRRQRYSLHLDDKILTSWNSLMIAAMCSLYRLGKKNKYIKAAVDANSFIKDNLIKDNTLYVSFRCGTLGKKGFLNEYANYIFAQLYLYNSTLDKSYLEQALFFCNESINIFWDTSNHGFYLYGNHNERLIIRPKDTYDGAMPSGNSVMAYNLVRLSMLTDDERFKNVCEQQIAYMSSIATNIPTAYAMYLTALTEFLDSPEFINIVIDNNDISRKYEDIRKIIFKASSSAIIKIQSGPTYDRPLKDGRTTYYVCKDHICLPPSNEYKK